MALCGAIRWAGFFLGGHQAPPTIQEMIKRNDERCFWLDPRFNENPAWLADEAEELEAQQKQGRTVEESGLVTPLTPPAATYTSALAPSVDYCNLPHPPHANHNPRPRGSPNIDAISPGWPSTPSSGLPSPLLIAPMSDIHDGMNPFDNSAPIPRNNSTSEPIDPLLGFGENRLHE